MVETLVAALEREHHEIDKGIAASADGSSHRESLARAMATLRRHIYLEEEFLFPPLRAAGLVAPVFVMVHEHGRMWQTLDALAAALDGGTGSTVDLVRALQEQLDAHNPKEEQILYPQADQVLTASATGELQAQLAAGRTPDGWVCEALRS
ncbi:MAG TPA: hemerythrin domain-containing protein [Pseudonocardiaceae bacterium]|nr:hemerythrin domain-containing protein [Pseudonocardiaceae bacterium]